ncbi:MAG: hypothetical protein Q8O99_01585 [bacterium]|nr:hypothetical protein [bacterium]
MGGSFPEGRLISFQRKKGVPQLVYQGKSIDCSPVSLDLTPTKKLVANYELAPTLG